MAPADIICISITTGKYQRDAGKRLGAELADEISFDQTDARSAPASPACSARRAERASTRSARRSARGCAGRSAACQRSLRRAADRLADRRWSKSRMTWAQSRGIRAIIGEAWRQSSVWGACSADLKLALPEIACDNGAQHVAEVCGSLGAEGMFEPSTAPATRLCAPRPVASCPSWSSAVPWRGGRWATLQY